MGVLLLGCIGLTALLFAIPVQSDIFANLGGVNLLFTVTIVTYLLLMVLYSMHLKHVVLLDVFVIASGFVLRTLAGAVVIPVSISPWLYLVTILLSLFLALNKRRHELILLQDQADQLQSLHFSRTNGQSSSNVDDPLCSLWNVPLSLPRVYAYGRW